jgi:hypothetical protein
MSLRFDRVVQTGLEARLEDRQQFANPCNSEAFASQIRQYHQLQQLDDCP